MSLAGNLLGKMVDGVKPEEPAGYSSVIEEDYLDRARLDFNGLKRFRKLAEEAGMTVTIDARRVLVHATTYASSGNGHAAGDIKKPAYEQEAVWAVAVAHDRSFAAWAHWEDGTLLIGRFGGPFTGTVVATAQITPILNALKAYQESRA